jgi:hypothetical protein
MLFDLETFGADAPLPTDVTLRTPIYRRHGIIASLIASGFTRLASRGSRPGKRRGGNAPPLSDHLRRDIGLPTESSRSPVWEDIRWK